MSENSVSGSFASTASRARPDVAAPSKRAAHPVSHLDGQQRHGQEEGKVRLRRELQRSRSKGCTVQPPCMCGPLTCVNVCGAAWSFGSPVEDELMRQCKFWQVTMRPAPPKEKADAAAQRHSRIRGDLAEAEKAYNETQQAAVQAVRDWCAPAVARSLRWRASLPAAVLC